jgi:hypothetical protein
MVSGTGDAKSVPAWRIEWNDLVFDEIIKE